MPDELPDISVVVPVYGCSGALVELHRRLTDTLTGARATYELIFVEDRGPDDSWAQLEALARRDPHTGIYRTPATLANTPQLRRASHVRGDTTSL